jgi:hypothetical protein
VGVFWLGLKIVAALGAALVLYELGAAVVRNFAKGHAEPDEIDVPLADVDYRFRCVVCGAEVIMYAAPDGEVPTPPRHCAERMALITPVT